MADSIYLRDHLLLTAIELSDKANLIQYLNDPVIYRNTLLIPFPYAESDADRWLNLVHENREKNNMICTWAIRHIDHGLIGCIGFQLKSGVEGHFDEIGYWLAEPFRGQGIMTDAIKALCHWLFETRPALVRIEARVHSFNPISARVLEKAGFEREGYLRKANRKNGELIDVILMAKIRA